MIPLVAPTITRRDRDHLAHACYNGLLESEAMVRRFEEAFAGRVGCVGAVAVCSGSAALALALEALDCDPSAPSYSCSAIFNAMIASTGWSWNYVAENCLVDSSFDVRTAQMVQHGSTIIVHAFGKATRMATTPHGPIEDWTLSLGVGHAGLGRGMKVGVCSTHASKMLSTGRGGVIFSNDEALLKEVRETAYYDSEPNGLLGCHSLGMTSMQAALGLSQLQQLDRFIERRREIAHVYSAAFEAAGIECPDPDCGSVFFRYLIGVDDPADKLKKLAEHGIEAGRGVYPPLHRQLGLPDEQFPGATACVNRLLSVPCHPMLTSRDVEFVAAKVIEVCAWPR